MKSYVWVTFGLLAVAYYQLSDGADFTPGETGVDVFARVAPSGLPEIAPETTVSRLALVGAGALAPAAGETLPDEQVRLEAAVLAAIGLEGIEGATEVAAAGAAAGETAAGGARVAHPAAGTSPSLEAAPAARDLRAIKGAGVNLRAGPGTGYGILEQLARGTPVEVLEDDGAGWVRLRVMPGGATGWIADFLLEGS